MPLNFAPLFAFDDEVLLIARIIMGGTMIYYGWFKVKDLRANANDFVQMGFRPGIFWGTIIAVLEFFGGIAAVIGLYVWVVAALMIVHMGTGTVWKITKTDKPFTDWSYDLLLLAIALLLLITGAGSYSMAALLA